MPDPDGSECSFPNCDCPGEDPACDDFDDEGLGLGPTWRTWRPRLCPVHTVPEPCPTCSAYIAAGL